MLSGGNSGNEAQATEKDKEGVSAIERLLKEGIHESDYSLAPLDAVAIRAIS